MQHHQCYICKADSLGGGSKVFGGMFFKLCAECLEEEEAIRLMNEQWEFGDEEESETPDDRLPPQ